MAQELEVTVEEFFEWDVDVSEGARSGWREGGGGGGCMRRWRRRLLLKQRCATDSVSEIAGPETVVRRFYFKIKSEYYLNPLPQQ